jgi:hypothetical protein
VSKPKPTNPKLWAKAISKAKSKFRVYPSAYANAWASKWYKSQGGGWESSTKTEEVERNGKWDVTHKDLPDGKMMLIHHPTGKRRVLDKLKAQKIRDRINHVRRLWDQAPKGSRPAPFADMHKHIDSVLTQCCLGRMAEDLMIEEYRGGLRGDEKAKWVAGSFLAGNKGLARKPLRLIK